MSTIRDLARHPRRRAWLGVLLVLLAIGGVGATISGCGDHDHAAGGKYYCPMHPTYVADQPGDCPICTMRLVPLLEKGGSPGVAGSNASSPPPGGQAAGRSVLFYRHPMDPGVTSPVPMKDATGMDYRPVFADDGGAGAPAGLPGLAPVAVDEQALRLSGVGTAVATRGEVAHSTRAVGLVTADERLVRHVETRISGWVEKLHVNTTGQLVRAGQPVMSIYSPELLASQQELLRAKQAAARFATSSLPEVRRGGQELVEAARQRLELFGVPRGFVAQLERRGEPQRAVTMTAPSSGFVTTKNVFEGQQVQPGVELFTLTDLSHLWVEAELYASEASMLRLGQTADIRLPYEPGRTRRGTVSFISPVVSPQSRTLKVRLELDNRDGALKPGMYVDVVSGLGGASGVTVPDDAVIDSGERQIVFVQTAPGSFTPRRVRVGVRGDGRALILAGLAEGETVATRANFLLDSESRLRAAVAGATRPAEPTPTAHEDVP